MSDILGKTQKNLKDSQNPKPLYCTHNFLVLNACYFRFSKYLFIDSCRMCLDSSIKSNLLFLNQLQDLHTKIGTNLQIFLKSLQNSFYEIKLNLYLFLIKYPWLATAVWELKSSRISYFSIKSSRKNNSSCKICHNVMTSGLIFVLNTWQQNLSWKLVKMLWHLDQHHLRTTF